MSHHLSQSPHVFVRLPFSAVSSVTSSTIIANSSSLFTYLFNIMARTESFTLRKTGGVGLALLGTVLVCPLLCKEMFSCFMSGNAAFEL